MTNGMRQPYAATSGGVSHVAISYPQHGRHHDRDLLARRLPADIEPLRSGGAISDR
jgi:hypothetical protein